MRLIALLIAVSLFGLASASEKKGKFINPITDINWEGLFPITVSGVNVTQKHKDLTKHTKRVCMCAGVPPKIGIPLTFWEPLRLVDVTRHTYRMVGLGGVELGKESVKNRGSVGIIGDGPSQSSFYHVHVYHFPVLALLAIFPEFSCLSGGEIDVPFMSEWDPSWGDDHLAMIIHPEASLFGNALAQTACAGDCLASSARKPQDELFWCAGCHGSLYPLTGTVAHHSNSLQASSLILYRALAKLHRVKLLLGYGKDDYCEAQYLPIIRKSLYKTQMVFPIAQTDGPCVPLGQSDLMWGRKKPLPSDDESFCYLVWSKKQCCLDAVRPIAVGGL